MEIGQAQKGTGMEAGQTRRIWTRDFILICFANFFIFLGFQMTLPTIPLFVEHLGGNDQMIGYVVGAFTFSALLIRPYAGQALESRGRKFVFLIGLAIFVLSVGSFGFAGGMAFLFLMRFVQGLGWGFSTTASGTIATDLIPAERRGEGMGYYGLSGNIALAAGPSLGLILAGLLTFQNLFLLCAALGLGSLLLASMIRYKKVEKSQKTVAVKWDFYEKTAVQPSILLFFMTVTFGGIASFLPLYTAQKGIVGIQWYFLIYALALMLTRAFAGQLYDRKGHRAVFIPGALFVLAAMILLAWLPNTAVLYIAAALYGFGFGTVQPGLQAWALEKSPRNRRGMANATFFSFFDLGVGAGALLFGQIGHIFGYGSIYKASAISIFISILYYLVLLRKEALQKRLPE
ncbi:MFS transporter [Bacillus sp. B-jedd]|uniref:MFS transporter n=1 Tax=Bacillus sp. B-jedd TaxID=1476857 RepID=UPI0005157146|nr:MFS transporter [Bacillus sp. B-jedd]CEG28351.1 major facilitator transporter [Bacillus sp. B-jedd]